MNIPKDLAQASEDALECVIRAQCVINFAYELAPSDVDYSAELVCQLLECLQTAEKSVVPILDEFCLATDDFELVGRVFNSWHGAAYRLAGDVFFAARHFVFQPGSAEETAANIVSTQEIAGCWPAIADRIKEEFPERLFDNLQARLHSEVLRVADRRNLAPEGRISPGNETEDLIAKTRQKLTSEQTPIFDHIITKRFGGDFEELREIPDAWRVGQPADSSIRQRLKEIRQNLPKAHFQLEISNARPEWKWRKHPRYETS